MSLQSNSVILGRGLLATLWGAIGSPIIWVALTPVIGRDSDAVLVSLAASIVLAMAGYLGTLWFIRYWKR